MTRGKESLGKDADGQTTTDRIPRRHVSCHGAGQPGSCHLRGTQSELVRARYRGLAKAKLVEQDAYAGNLLQRGITKGYPHVHDGQFNALALLLPQRLEEHH